MGILNQHLMEAIQFHNKLHVLRTVRGTGTVSLESNLLQNLVAMRGEVVYEIFLDFYNAYDALYYVCCLGITTAYCVGPWALHLLQ